MPKLLIEPDRKVELEDWSEKGLRIRLSGINRLTVGDVLTLRITLPEEEPISAEGTVVWLDEHSAAIQLASLTLPWRILLNEQRALARWRTKLIEVREEQERS